jgi:hypothetical protein
LLTLSIAQALQPGGFPQRIAARKALSEAR